MKRYAIYGMVLAAVSLAAVQGCGGGSGETGGAGGESTTSTTSTTSSTTSSTSSTSTTSNPPPPAIGMQIDRFGRPAINTALNHTFDSDSAAKGAAKDAWNADSNVGTWATTYGPQVAANLAILDSLDTVCGNQLLATPVAAGDPIPATRYGTLAGALADDQLYVKTDAAACGGVYLAVEANATGLLANGDCGGRKLDVDVIDISYSALAVGALSGVGDGVDADADTKGTTFPYLANPH